MKYDNRREAIIREIIEPLGEHAIHHDIEAIADEVLGDHSEGFVPKVDAEQFWEIASKHRTQLRLCWEGDHPQVWLQFWYEEGQDWLECVDIHDRHLTTLDPEPVGGNADLTDSEPYVIAEHRLLERAGVALDDIVEVHYPW